MSKTHQAYSLALHSFVVLLFSFFCFQVEAQWTTPDGSGNIYNNNTGQVIVQAPSGTSNVGNLFYVNPRGKGAITLGEINTASGGYTSLALGISADQGGYSTIQSVQASGSAWGVLALNNQGGNVGIGTTTPGAVLEITGSELQTPQGSVLDLARMGAYSGNYSQIHFTLNRFAQGNSWNTTSTRMQAWTDVSPQGYMEFNPSGDLDGIGFGNGSTEYMRLSSGNLLLGKTSQTNTGYMLDVNGNGRLNQVVVNTTGADYVFDPGYRLNTLHDLERYISKEHHLPGIAPAAQMQQEGLNLGDNQTRLLEKIEELTLYLIQQDKETQALKEKIKTLEERNRTLESLEQRIEKLEQKNKAY